MHLRLVESIDLSFNHLESFDNRLFEFNKHLYKLNFEGNKFMMLSNEPFVRSLPLRSLNLRNTQINFLPSQLFAAIPQLQHLDVSNNLLITLNVAAFNHTNQLLTLNIVGNLWKCEDVAHDVRELKNRSIEVLFDDCQEFSVENSENQQFQRMEMAATYLSAPKTIVRPKWRRIYNEEDDNMQDYIKMDNEAEKYICENKLPTTCQRYKNCLREILNTMDQRKLALNDMTDVHSELEPQLVFLLGVAVGVTTIIVILIAALCFKACIEVRKKLPDSSQSALENVTVIAPQMPTRVRRCRRRAATTQALTPGSDNFIARLFGRPARHQYFRTLNQNTATLIRRLSRSNLLTNRTNQNISDRNANEPSFTCYVRAETPPPSYIESTIVNEDRPDSRTDDI